MHETTTSSTDIVLSPEQEHVLSLVDSGQNVFFTGPAGTGKSVLLREIIRKLRPDPGSTNGVAVTASTGIAALNIGGMTLHSFAGIGLGKQPVDVLVKSIKRSIGVLMRWRTTRVLIIDEISMIDGALFSKLEEIARTIRKSSKLFGGIQLVISGDFFQLPPVPDRSHNYEGKATYCFEVSAWRRCISRPIFLSKVFRQKDPTFITLLTHMRHGLLTREDIQHLKSLSRPLQYEDGIVPCEIFPVRSEVDYCNQARLKALPGPQYAYHAMDSAGYDDKGKPIEKHRIQDLLNRMIAPQGMVLKKGAQVMLNKNTEEGVLVNGSIGKVMDFLTIMEATEQNVKIAKQNTPTNHDDNLPPTSNYFQRDMMRPMTGHIFSSNEKWPLVLFENGKQLLCAAVQFTTEGRLGHVEARRVQVPLILAWALSIHKSQGQTLERVKVNLGRTFEKGQAYVAISRATSMDGLELKNFDAEKVMAHPRVTRWHEFWDSLGNGDLPDDSDDEILDRLTPPIEEK